MEMSYTRYLKELNWFNEKILSAWCTLEEKRSFVVEMDKFKSKYPEYEEARKNERCFSSTIV